MLLATISDTPVHGHGIDHQHSPHSELTLQGDVTS